MSTTESPKPYRVEWRYSSRHVWTLMDEVSEHEEAHEIADDAVKRHKGCARVTVQHVIYRVSL